MTKLFQFLIRPVIAQIDPDPSDPYAGIFDFDELRQSLFPGTFVGGANLTIGSILSRIIPYVYVIAGIFLLFLLIGGGFKMMTGGGDAKSKAEASKEITNAIVGFLILFASYWVVMLVETIFGVAILK